MSKLDDLIALVAYNLDTLRVYRDIVNSGDCNVCEAKNHCEYCPEAGQLVRYNCPHFVRGDKG